ncbi:MAG TPA: GNAT family N-acetyltransferase [Vicinamibacterales bacterium]|nr:GNAT family N-acetyltransferase [Vicinamibacterales bacterium]
MRPALDGIRLVCRPAADAAVGVAAQPVDACPFGTRDGGGSTCAPAAGWVGHLASLEAAWEDLLCDSEAGGPFLTWEWLTAWWTHLGGGARLRAAVVRAGGDVVAIAPLVEECSFSRAFPRLRLMGTGCAGSDYLDVIARRGHEEKAVAALARLLADRRVPIWFEHVRPDSTARRVAAHLSAAGWSVVIAPDGVCPVIDLAGQTWESYLDTLGRAHRANVRRRLRGLNEAFRVSFALVATERERRDALAALAAFHERRWRRHGGSTALSTGALRAFHDEATRRALARGWLRMYVLRLDDAVAAVMYGFFHERQFYFYQHGFDDRYRQHSVGLALMALTIQAAIMEGAETFDLLWGAEAYKWLWARAVSRLERIELYPPTARGRLHQTAVAIRRRLPALVRAAIRPAPSSPGGIRV